jgi:excinuclease ABC subunit C
MQKSELPQFELPDVPGVYIFTVGKGRGKKILYIGKATSLRDRVRSYFDDDLIATRGPRIVDMVTNADRVEYETTPTVLEALVREAALIREHRPPANTEGKDDKSFLYAIITDEEIPRVLAVRGKDIDFEAKIVNGTAFKDSYGPFPSGFQLREGLRLIRRIFPFYDTPKPVGTKGKHQLARIEFNQQINQYPRGISEKEYNRNIRNVGMFLSGRVKTLRQTITKEMNQAAKDEEFEDAGTMRNQLFSLDHIQDREKFTEGPRIEAYDTAHISGTNAIGVMTVIQDGQPQKKEYRTFKIKGIKKNDDIASLKEILSRRMGHPEWAMPRAIVIDGGKTHKKAAESTLSELGIGIPVVAVVKDERHRPREVIGAIRAGITDADAVLANSEAHRFSLARHREARKKNIGM